MESVPFECINCLALLRTSKIPQKIRCPECEATQMVEYDPEPRGFLLITLMEE